VQGEVTRDTTTDLSWQAEDLELLLRHHGLVYKEKGVIPDL